MHLLVLKLPQRSGCCHCNSFSARGVHGPVLEQFIRSSHRSRVSMWSWLFFFSYCSWLQAQKSLPGPGLFYSSPGWFFHSSTRLPTQLTCRVVLSVYTQSIKGSDRRVSWAHSMVICPSCGQFVDSYYQRKQVYHYADFRGVQLVMNGNYITPRGWGLQVIVLIGVPLCNAGAPYITLSYGLSHSGGTWTSPSPVIILGADQRFTNSPICSCTPLSICA